MWYYDVAFPFIFDITKNKGMNDLFFSQRMAAVKRNQINSWSLYLIGLSMLLVVPAFAQKTPAKAQIQNTQQKKAGQDLVNQLNSKLKANRAEVPQKASNSNTTKLTPPKALATKKSDSQNLISSIPPKPKTQQKFIPPPSKKIPGINPAARAAQISPKTGADRLNPANKAAQMNPVSAANRLNPANKLGIPAAKKTAAAKKGRPIRDIKYKREHYKAKRNNL